MNEDLRIRTKQFALRIIGLFTALPRTEVARVLGKQSLRSGTSVGANYREAFRARSDLEFISKVGDCLKELEEIQYWLELLVESGTVSATKIAVLHQETNEFLAIFTSISKKTKARSQSS
jgi:four helix bundle protein